MISRWFGWFGFPGLRIIQILRKLHSLMVFAASNRCRVLHIWLAPSFLRLVVRNLHADSIFLTVDILPSLFFQTSSLVVVTAFNRLLLLAACCTLDLSSSDFLQTSLSNRGVCKFMSTSCFSVVFFFLLFSVFVGTSLCS